MKLNKVQRILNLFKDKEDYKFWNVKTKITTIIDKTYLNFTSIESSKRIPFIKVEKYIDNQYSLVCNGIKITPTDKKMRIVSLSAIRQYLDVLETFRIIKRTDKISNEYKIINEEFLNFDTKFDSTHLFEILYRNFNKLSKKGKELFYSTVVSWLAIDYLDNYDTLEIIYGKDKNKKVTCDQIYKMAKDCGYDLIKNDAGILGYDLDDIYLTLINLFKKQF